MGEGKSDKSTVHWSSGNKHSLVEMRGEIVRTEGAGPLLSGSV